MEWNKVLYKDCMDKERGLPTLFDELFNTIILDPPYNIGKDEWDRIKDYISWIDQLISECARVLKKNGTFWIFHIDFEALVEIHQIMKKYGFNHKQLIIIDKGIQSVVGRCNLENSRSFPRATEYLQFYTFKDMTGAEQLSNEYIAINPFAKYLKEEIKRANVCNKELSLLFPSKTGNPTGCVSNWIIGYNVPLKWQYEKIRAYLNEKTGHEYLKRDYEDLKRDYEKSRYIFNCPMGITDVWKIDFYKNPSIHKARKPVRLILQILKACTDENSIVLDPCAGSGSVFEACEMLGLSWLGFEADRSCEKEINQSIQRGKRNILRKQQKLFTSDNRDYTHKKRGE